MNAPKTESRVTTGKSCPAQLSHRYAVPIPASSSTQICAMTSNSEIFPEGIGRYGSLIASISRSYQSLIVWVYPVRNGPESTMHVAAFARSVAARPSGMWPGWPIVSGFHQW